MATKPILFSGPMVRAILEGRKPMTRRVMKPQVNGDIAERHLYVDLRSPFQPGDILWVRETWLEHKGTYIYMADGKHLALDALIGGPFFKWRPSIFMPKEAARLFLRVTAVRAERVQEITDEDAIREGANCDEDGRNVGLAEKIRRGPVERFRDLWDSINGMRAGGAYSWDKNPWVWVITFERVDKPAGWPEV